MPTTTLVFKEKLIYRTPMGVDDRANAEEDRVGFIAVADLLANDLGGAAKSFWGIDQTDPRLVTMTAVSREGASLSVDLATGEIAYDPTAAFASVIQSLAEGETATDSFTYTIRMADGALSTATVSLTIMGMNDAVRILPGTTASGAVAEDGVAQAAGVIRFTDDDLSDLHGVSVTPLSGTAFGTLTLGTVDEAAGAAGGSVGWSYTLDNAAAQALAAGQTVTERFAVAVSDGKGGTATQVVEVAVAGVNDRPFFTSRFGDSAAVFLTETDSGLTSGLRTSTLVDPDATDALSVEVRSVKVFLTDGTPDDDTVINTAGLDDAALAGLGLDRAEIIDWFDIRPTNGDAFVGTGDNNATWVFDSQDEAFDFLDAGEVLTIYYNSIRPLDGQGGAPIGDGGLVIRITGTADDLALV